MRIAPQPPMAQDPIGREAHGFTPAFPILSIYDPVVRLLSRDRAWRSEMLRLLSPKEGETVVDAGCGTGTFLEAVARRTPGARLIGVDPDPKILERAHAKLAKTGSTVELHRGFLRDLKDLLGGATVSKLVSSLVLHQVPMAEKRAGLVAMLGALVPGGMLLIADYGLQRTRLARTLFRLVQSVDGAENTQPNADGILPELMEDAGFKDVAETRVFLTPTRTISVYCAWKP